MTTIAVTTTVDSAPRHAAALEAVGLTPVTLPCISVTPADRDELAAVRTSVADADLIILTSARVVGALWPDGGMPAIPAAVVGPSTAAAVLGAGGRCRFVGSGGAEALLAGLGNIADCTVAYPHARGADPAIEAELARRARRVDGNIVYETTPVSPGERHVDGVMFSSPSAVTGWRIGRSLPGLVVAAIGHTTGTAVLAGGGRVDVMPSIPDLTEMTQLLALHFASVPTGRAP